MKFLSESGDYVDSMISPLWGGIQLLNPSDEYCANGTSLVPNSKEVIGLFTSQFHSLLGISQQVSCSCGSVRVFLSCNLYNWLWVVYTLEGEDLKGKSIEILKSIKPFKSCSRKT